MKIYRRESANRDFPCAKLENAKKIRQNFFCRLWQNPELILINMFRPTYVPNLVTLAWKMSSGRSTEAGSLNGRLCAYSMRQNLHDRTCPRPWCNKCPCQVWKWSVKNCGRESVNGARIDYARKVQKQILQNANFLLKGMDLKIQSMEYQQLCVVSMCSGMAWAGTAIGSASI